MNMELHEKKSVEFSEILEEFSEDFMKISDATREL